jgi:tripartite-type tricarboxylate transporter receptor subunit TctC
MNAARRKILRSLSGATALMLLGAKARAEAFPARPIHLLVGAGPGSVPDLVARVIGDELSAEAAQPVVVENRPGAGGILAMQALASSRPDGYTIALATMSQLVFNGYLFSKLPYDTARDLAPICPLIVGALAIAAHPSLPAATLAEVVAFAKSHPGRLTIGTPSNGSPPDLVARLLVRAAGIDVLFVPFRTGVDGLSAALRGDVHLFVDAPPLIAPHVRTGALKAVAVTGREREPELPGVPTVAEESFPGAEAEIWLGLVAPAGTPDVVVAYLGQKLAALMQVPQFQQKFAKLSFRPLPGSGNTLRALIDEGRSRWGPTITEAGIKLD